MRCQLINRETIRKCLVKVINEDKCDFITGIYEIEKEVLLEFDSQPGVTDVPSFTNFMRVMAERYSQVDWAMVRCAFDLFFTSTVSQLPRQTLPKIDMKLTFNTQVLSLGQTRIGGEPDWLQCPQPSEEFPLCSDCSQIMAFVCQIDSLGARNQVTDLQDFRFAFSGTVYLFACAECQRTFSTFQCD